MMAITIWQPWASLIAIGAKPHEFRKWAAPRSLRGQRIAIHAGARPVRKADISDLLLRLHSQHWCETGLLREPAIELLERVHTAPGILPLSSILCTAILGQPIHNEELATTMGLPPVNDSDRGEHTNWGWPLTDIRRLEPFVPARGAQGWWRWNEGTANV